MQEIFKDIPNYEGMYQVSNLGNVKSINYRRTNKEKILKLRLDRNGYLLVALCKNGSNKNFLVHRLVAHAFVEGYFEGAQVDHIDTVKTNNVYTNLRWTTASENANNIITIQKKSKAMMGNSNSKGNKNRLNKKHSEYTKLKISKTLSKPIICIETNNIYLNAKEASKSLGIDRGNICSCCLNKVKTAGGYHWKYLTNK